MEVVGYCMIKKGATPDTGEKHAESFQRAHYLRVMEFTPEGDAFCINPEGDALAVFEKKDVIHRFECALAGEVICPPGLDLMEQMAYSSKIIMRKGGYNNTLRQMVILNSLKSGKVNDDFLFAVESQEQAREQSKK